MLPKSPSCGAVVVTYNSVATVQRCLESLQANNAQPIVVVDNASQDTTLRVVQQYPLQIFPQSDNRGFATACNIGAAHLKSEFMLFLNPDARLAPGALASALVYFQAHPHVAAVGLCLVDEEGMPQLDNFGDEVTLRTVFTRKLFIRRTVPQQPTVCDWVSAGAVVVRREAFNEIDGFDENYFLYWEDVDFCKRLRAAGWQVVWLPHATAIHQRGHSLTDQRRKTELYDASADRYFRTHYAGWIWLLQHYLRRLFRLFSPQVH